jgi:hypothetical protein
MAKGKVSVSSDFNKFYGRHQMAINEAKKAENSMSSGPCPVGWEGNAILLEAAAEVGKDRKDDKGNTVPGNPRVRMKFGIVGDQAYQGKTFQKFWSFYASANASEMDRYEWFLNEMENMGLPRAVRESHDDPSELLQWFVDNELVFHARCESDDYSRDKKAMKVSAPEAPVDSTTNMSPEGNTTVATESSPEIAEGDVVKFLGSDWTVDAREGDKLSISREGRSRSVSISAVSKA